MKLRFLAAAFMVVSVSACNCGGTTNPDGGTGDGGGGTVDSGPSPMDQFCSMATVGYKNMTKVSTKQCGLDIKDTDWDHIEVTVDGPFGPSPLASNEAWAGTDCGNKDGGLFQQMAIYSGEVTAGRMTYDQAKALECQAFGRDGGSAFDVFGRLQGPCAQVWTGKVAAGGACNYNYVCASGTYCKHGVNSCAGTCTTFKAIGQACSDFDPCAPDALCKAGADGGTSTCVTLPNQNETCDPAVGCKPGFICHGEEGSEKCVTVAKMGQPCTRIVGVGSNCGEGTCVVNIDTDGGVTVGTGTCQAYATVGKACGDSFHGVARCDGCTTCTGGTCQTSGMENGDCATDDDCFDTRFLYCKLETSKCTYKPRLTQGCYRTDDGEGGLDTRGNCMFFDNYCSVIGNGGFGDPGTCMASPKLGEACGLPLNLSSECTTGYCKVTDGGEAGNCADLPKTGEACAATQNAPFGYTDCALSTDFCDAIDSGGDVGVCHPRRDVGQACGQDGDCKGDLVCDKNSQCAALLDVGQACTANADCKSGSCPKVDGGTRVCVALLATGAACTKDGDCESDTCDPLSKVCVAACAESLSNESGCMNYDLTSMTSYLTFSLLLGLMVFPRRRR